MFYGQPFMFNLIMYVMFPLRPFTVHNVFLCFYGPNKVIIIILLFLASLLIIFPSWKTILCDDTSHPPSFLNLPSPVQV